MMRRRTKEIISSSSNEIQSGNDFVHPHRKLSNNTLGRSKIVVKFYSLLLAVAAFIAVCLVHQLCFQNGHISIATTPTVSLRMSSNHISHMWDDEPFIHIINTRFMQSQGKFTALAKARLHLLKTFTLPSILAQSSQKFIWVIKVSPSLDEGIMKDLISTIDNAVSTSGNSNLGERIFIVSSNTNFQRNYGAWRGGEEMKEVLSHLNDNSNTTNSIDPTAMRGGIHTGNLNLLHRIEVLEPSKIMLQSRLDADDGIHEKYLETIQAEAVSRFTGVPVGKTSSNDSSTEGDDANADDVGGKTQWFYWCSTSYVKWYLDAEGEYGRLEKENNPKMCVTPGLTLGFNVGAQLEELPYGHQMIIKKLRRSDGDLVDCGAGEGIEQTCYSVVNADYGGIRSRTLSSAGMNDVFSKKKSNNENDELWEMVQTDFHILQEDVAETKKHFLDNEKEIARENMKGQCTKGHSCKKKNKETLRTIMEQ